MILYCIHDCLLKDISKPSFYVDYPCHMILKTLIKCNLKPQKFTCIKVGMCPVFLLTYSSKQGYRVWL